MWKEHFEDLERKRILLLWSGMFYKGQLINLVDHVVQFYILTDFLLVLSMTEREVVKFLMIIVDYLHFLFSFVKFAPL